MTVNISHILLSVSACSTSSLKLHTKCPKACGHANIPAMGGSWTGFRLSTRCGTWLQRGAPIQTQEREWGPTLMLGGKTWLTGNIPVHRHHVGQGRALCRPVKFFYTKLGQPVLYGAYFVHRCIFMLKHEIINANWCYKVWVKLF